MSPSSTPVLATTRNSGLDLLRMTAIMLVLWSHPPVTPPAHVGILSNRLGPTGVDLFFVLSGFLIGSLLFDEISTSGRLDVKRFWIRRFLKIVPPYMLLVIVSSILNMIRNSRDPLAGLCEMWPNFVHIQNYVRGDRPLGQTWSLAVEEHFYLTLPCALVVMGIRNKVWSGFPLFAFGVFLISFLSRLLLISVPYAPQTHMFATHIRIDSLMLGVLLAWLAKTNHPLLDTFSMNWKLTLFVGFIFIGTPCMFDWSHPFVFTLGYSLRAVGYALIVTLGYKCTVDVRPSSFFLLEKISIQVGRCSYSIYLWMAILAERPLEYIAGRSSLDSDVKYWFFLIVYVTWASIVGIVMNFIIETPINSYRNRIFPRARVQ